MKAAILATVVALTLLFPASSLVAQQGQTPPSRVAVIDIAMVFEKHTGFNARMESIKQEVKNFEDELTVKRDSIMERAAALQQKNAGSPDFKELEAQLAKEEADLQIRAAQKRKEVLDKEAAIYLETYNEVVDAVRRISEYNGITLVLRFDKSEIDPTDRASVIKGVNRNVVFHRGDDLTEMVVEMVTPRAANNN